jgi:hypothetical protein
MRAGKYAGLALFVLLGWLADATAHEGGTTGYATLAFDGRQVRYSLTLWPRTLPSTIGPELEKVRSGDAAVTRQWLDILRDKVHMSVDGTPCTAGDGRTEPASSGTDSVTLLVSFHCRDDARELSLRDDLFDVMGADHHTLVRIEAPIRTRQVALAPDAREARVALGSADEGGQVIGFVRLGIEHILTGYDHLLFLAALLLGGGSALQLLKVVTAFTIGHSGSLAAAVLGVVTIPAWLVESVIAGSIAWVAIENTRCDGPIRRRWLTALGFGLVHGLGFASALAPLDLPPWNLAGALLSFNVGVETGQAIVIALIAPGIVWLSGRDGGRRTRRLLSLTVAALGCAWFVARIAIAGSDLLDWRP